MPEQPSDHPLVLTFLNRFDVTPEVIDRLRRVAPGLEVQVVPYEEDTAARSVRTRAHAAGPHTAIDHYPPANVPTLTDDQWAALERSTAVVALDLPDGVTERCQSLRWVQAIGAGTEHLDGPGFKWRGVVLANGAGLAAPSIAEFVLGRLIEVWKAFRTFDRQQAEKKWHTIHGRRVAGMTLGIVGLGAIGRATAKRARAFDMRVLANRRRATAGDTDPDVDELFAMDALDDMLARCDAVVVSAAANDSTIGLFDGDRIAAMKPGAILCNVARGSLVVDDAVLEALQSGHLGAAVLDVTSQEPLPEDSPLWTAPNSYISPHTAVSLDGYDEALLELIERNLGHLVRGEPLDNVVDPG